MIGFLILCKVHCWSTKEVLLFLATYDSQTILNQSILSSERLTHKQQTTLSILQSRTYSKLFFFLKSVCSLVLPYTHSIFLKKITHTSCSEASLMSFFLNFLIGFSGYPCLKNDQFNVTMTLN